MRYVLALPGIDIKVHLLTRIAQNSNEILAEFANQKTEDGGFILDLIHRLLGVGSEFSFGHLVFKTFGQNFYKSLWHKSINAKKRPFKNCQKCAEIYRNVRVLSKN
jgi:hypothetical protein